MKNKLFYRKRLSQLAYSLCLMLLFSTASWGQLLTVTTAGTGSYTVPAGVTSIKISTWGAGGAGGSAKTTSPGVVRGGGGAGGSFAQTTISVVEGNVINYTVGAGGVGTAIAALVVPTTSTPTTAQSGSGGDTFATLGTDVVRAVGGQGGLGGFSIAISPNIINGTGGVATTTGNVGGGFFAGGDGQTVTGLVSGGGGSSAGSAIIGNPGAAGVGGAAVFSGGAGGAGTNVNNATGTPGSPPGGGGGGACARGATGGAGVGSSGGAGKLIIENAASPTIVVIAPTFSAFVATSATASTAQSFTVAGSSLSSNLTVSTVSTDYELSTDSAFSSPAGAATITLTAPVVATTTIYVRLKSGLSSGGKTANIVIASTGANTVSDLVCTGGVSATYYYFSGLLSSNTSWWTNTDGTGANPTTVADAFATFVIRNTTAISTDAAWVLGTSSKLIVGGAAEPAVALTIAATFPITGGTIDIPAASSGANQVFCQATPLPTSFGTLDANSEVHLQPATNATYYFGSTVYGKLFIDGTGIVSNANQTFTSTIQTLLYVAANSTLSFSSSTTAFIYFNPGASATIDGTFRSGKTAGLFSVVASLALAPSGGNFQLNTTATLILSNTSTIEYNRGLITNSQPIFLPAGVVFNNLTIANNTLGTVTAPIVVVGKLTVNTGANLVAGGFLTLKSTATKTAVVAPITTGTITGNVIVERYIPAGHRAYRLLSSPVTATSIAASWQAGTHITGAGGATNGFDATGINASSLYTHDNAFSTWNAVASTSGVLTAGSPYLIYVRGSRLSTNIDPVLLTNDAATLSATGTLVTGTIDVSSTLNPNANGFSLIGNPYQAQVDMQAVLAASTNLDQTYYYVLNPKLGTKGEYVAVDVVTPANNTGDANQYLQPGQACFVKTVAAPTAAPTLSFTETNKSDAVTQTSVFRKAAVSAAK